MINIFKKSVNRFLLRAGVLLSGACRVRLHTNSIYSSRNILEPWNIGINGYDCVLYLQLNQFTRCGSSSTVPTHEAQLPLFLDVVQMGTMKEGCKGEMPIQHLINRCFSQLAFPDRKSSHLNKTPPQLHPISKSL